MIPAGRITLLVVCALNQLLPTAPAQTSAGMALSFGGGSSVAISNSAALNLFPITIMGWVDNQSFGSGLTPLVNKQSFPFMGGYHLSVDSGQVWAGYTRDFSSSLGDPGRGFSGGFLPFGWNHVAFTVDEFGGRIYVNGQLQGTQPWFGTPGATTNTQSVLIGRSEFSFFFGSMDEVSIWNVALSREQIATARHRRLSANEPGLVAYWPFEEGSGIVTADIASIAGGNNLGFLSGPMWIPSGASLGPIVETFFPLRQTLTSATLNGRVTPVGLPTLAWFEWGTNGSFGNSTTPMSTSDPSNAVPISAEITGLAQGVTYMYRLVATNSNGRANGSVASFTQPIYPGPGGVPHIRSTEYNGTSSTVTFPAEPQWDRSVPMTIEAWAYRLDPSRYEIILTHDILSYWFGFGPNKLRFSRDYGTVAEVPAPMGARKWTHVAVSYDGAIARFYINGNYVAARALTNNGAGKMHKLQLGHSPFGISGPSAMLMGNLDEVRLWSVARTVDQIRDGMYREVRNEPGLEAAFPRGGHIEELSGLIGSPIAVTERIFGMVPRDLVVPRAAIQPSANGQINFASEYLGAEQLVLRYPDDPVAPDTAAHFVHTDDDLFVAIVANYKNPNYSIANSSLGLFLDTTYDRPPLAQYEQAQLLSQLDLDTNHTAWLNGDAAGSYYFCMTPPGLSQPRPCTPRALYQAAQMWCGFELDLDTCVEFRVSRLLLGTWDEYDGVALGHFNFTQFGDQTFVPESGFPDAPDTWLTMSYGQGSANLPRVQWSGRVYAGVSTSSPGLADHRVTLFAGGAAYSQNTDGTGRFSFDVPMPTGQVIYAQADLVAFGRHALPRIGTTGVQPIYVFTNDVRYPAIPGSFSGTMQLARTDFFVQKPLPASAITSATPTNPMCGTSVRQGVPGGQGEIVTIYGTNLHAEMEFYLSPYTTTVSDPASWTLIRADLKEIAANGTWVKVQTPYVPEHVRAYANASFIPSFTSKWRWVAYDTWFRIGRIPYSYFGQFSIQRPPYPLVHGFNFKNKAGAPSLNEFLACYGNNAYICVGAFGYCASRVPDPLYWALWWPVYYLWIDNSGGSCVGMAGTSLQLAHGIFPANEHDPLAIQAFGIDNPGFPGEWDTSNTGGRYTRPPIPKDIWARIRMNHGVQTSREYLYEAFWQLDFGLSTDPANGDPVGRLNDIRANPTGYAISMLHGIGEGHAVTPWRVEDNFGGDPNISRLFLYENNTPCAAGAAATDSCVVDQWIDINRSANTYLYGAKNWGNKGMFGIHVGIYTGEHHAPALETIEQVITIMVIGSADAHYTTANGEWGWRQDGTFVNTLAGIKAFTPLGSPDNYTRSVPVFLHSNSPLPSVAMNVRDTNAFLFHATSAGTMLQMEFPGGQPGARDQVQLGTHSNELASFRFTPQNAHSNIFPRIGFQLHSNACATFQWMGLTSESGKTQEFRALKNQRAVEYCNLTTRATQHYLRIDAVDGVHSNNTCAVFGPFNVPTGAVHCVVLSDWPSARRVRSELDLNADGIPDQVTTVAGISIDSDGDGMPDDWETLHQLNPNATDCDDGPDADPDRDGISNYGEYLSETHPQDPSSALRLDATYLPGNRVRLSWRAVPGRKYEVQYANTFEYVFRTLPGFPRVATSAQETFEQTLPIPGTDTRFYRLQLIP